MLPSIIVITKNTYRVVSLVDFNSGQSKDLSGNLRLITTKNETKIQRGLSRIDTFPRKGWANVSPRRSKVYSNTKLSRHSYPRSVTQVSSLAIHVSSSRQGRFTYAFTFPFHRRSADVFWGNWICIVRNVYGNMGSMFRVSLGVLEGLVVILHVL